MTSERRYIRRCVSGQWVYLYSKRSEGETEFPLSVYKPSSDHPLHDNDHSETCEVLNFCPIRIEKTFTKYPLTILVVVVSSLKKEY